MAKPKQLTREQVEQKKDAAAQFSENVLGDSDKADDFDNMSVEEYADKKNIEIVNRGRNKSSMANGNLTKAELLDQIDQLQQENDDLNDTLDAISDLLSPPSDEGDEDEDVDNSDSGDDWFSD